MASIALLALGVAGGLGWWWLKPDVRPAITRIEQLPPLKVVTPLPTSTLNALSADTGSDVYPISTAGNTVASPLPVISSTGLPATPGISSGIPAELPLTKMAHTRLEIPVLNLTAPIIPAPIHGDSWQVEHLGDAVGHLQKTAAPGTSGNTVLAGHVSLSNGADGPLARLANLRVGDTVVIFQAEQPFEYRVESTQQVDATAIDVTYPTDQAMLTLITCDEWDEAAGRYLKRLVVRASQVTP